jgi:Mlc titration factor MtfA (ptsG expression regulator)
MINGLFMNPYAVTSLEEYFTSGMEDYFLGKSLLLKSISPALFNKLESYNELEY